MPRAPAAGRTGRSSCAPSRASRIELGVSYLHPYRDERGWRFTGGPFTDEVNAFEFLAEAYEATEPGYAMRISVPVLWDKQAGTIVSNESADIVRMLNDWGDPAVDLYPEPLRAEIDALGEWIYADFQNGVYRAGFARSQEAYDHAFAGVFDAMARLEALLGERRYLAGDEITLADWRLFPTLVRFDAVYHTHFRCNGAPDHRQPEPVGLHARAVPAAGHRRHGRDGRDPRALLHDARPAEPEADHPGAVRSTSTSARRTGAAERLLHLEQGQRSGPAEVVALGESAAEVAQRLELLLGLDALGDHR